MIAVSQNDTPFNRHALSLLPTILIVKLCMVFHIDLQANERMSSVVDACSEISETTGFRG